MTGNIKLWSVNAAAQELGVDRSALVRLIGESTGNVKRWLNIQDGKIPDDRMAILRAWAERRDDKRFAPTILGKILSEGVDLDGLLLGTGTMVEALPSLPTNRAEVDLTQLEPVRMLIQAIVPVVVEQVRAQALPPRQDRLLTEEQAAELLAGISPRRRVRGVRIGKNLVWKESDILNFIARVGTRQK